MPRTIGGRDPTGAHDPRLVFEPNLYRLAARRVGQCFLYQRAAAALDLLAAAPLLSATTLAAALGMAVQNAAVLLDDFCRSGIAVEVTHRSKRRLFGLAGVTPLRNAVAPPYRPDAERGAAVRRCCAKSLLRHRRSCRRRPRLNGRRLITLCVNRP